MAKRIKKSFRLVIWNKSCSWKNNVLVKILHNRGGNHYRVICIHPVESYTCRFDMQLGSCDIDYCDSVCPCSLSLFHFQPHEYAKRRLHTVTRWALCLFHGCFERMGAKSHIVFSVSRNLCNSASSKGNICHEATRMTTGCCNIYKMHYNWFKMSRVVLSVDNSI